MIAALGYPEQKGLLATLHSNYLGIDDVKKFQCEMLKIVSVVSVSAGLCSSILTSYIKGGWLRMLSSICLAAGLVGLSTCGAASLNIIKFDFLFLPKVGASLLNLLWCAMLMFSVVTPIWMGLSDILIGKPAVKVCSPAIAPPLPQGGPVSTPPG
ncbi:MAG: hypothetical protein EHM48_04880 [Planctomycetaceae bacterium]|nr:MAG: hypothetical protein EHM48_04880 [Planctomycetaceae bacterium]